MPRRAGSNHALGGESPTATTRLVPPSERSTERTRWHRAAGARGRRRDCRSRRRAGRCQPRPVGRPGGGQGLRLGHLVAVKQADSRRAQIPAAAGPAAGREALSERSLPLQRLGPHLVKPVSFLRAGRLARPRMQASSAVTRPGYFAALASAADAGDTVGREELSQQGRPARANGEMDVCELKLGPRRAGEGRRAELWN